MLVAKIRYLCGVSDLAFTLLMAIVKHKLFHSVEVVSDNVPQWGTCTWFQQGKERCDVKIHAKWRNGGFKIYLLLVETQELVPQHEASSVIRQNITYSTIVDFNHVRTTAMSDILAMLGISVCHPKILFRKQFLCRHARRKMHAWILWSWNFEQEQSIGIAIYWVP